MSITVYEGGSAQYINLEGSVSWQQRIARQALITLVIVCICGSSVLSSVLTAAAAPNVVIIYADDLGYANISYNSAYYVSKPGVPYFAHTPNIDRIC